MYLIPEVKSYKKCAPFTIVGVEFELKGIDERVKKLCAKLPKGETKAVVSIDESLDDSYKMKLSQNLVEITGKNQQGAFYGVQTLRQILKNKECDLCEINDSPDFNDRGFYLDITRGRIPKLDTLKELVDTLAYYKINMLQLYVEHTYPFKEYDGIYQRTGYITPEELRELDAYCVENFIDFVPSLSLFGHLYELLTDERYKHLCELENYKDKTVFWCERMGHHTIDPLNPESFELIKSLIDQYMPNFTSNKFNICCDETFDLGTGRNIGKDKGRLYVDFVRKIVDYIKSKGKTPMMWGDIISRHADLIDDIGDGVLFLSWGYSKDEKPDSINKVKEAGKPQYVCPGLSNWTSLIELPQVSVPNITKMAKYGYDAGAVGLLNTCWGDYGHPSSIYACLYGMIFGGAKSWNANCEYSNFDEAMDILCYGKEGASKKMKAIANTLVKCAWYELVCDYSNEKFGANIMKCWAEFEPFELDECFSTIEDIIPYLNSEVWENEKVRENLICIAQGIQLMAAILMSKKTGERFGLDIKDAEEWLKEFSRLYLAESKMGELEEFVKVFYHLANKYLK
ncbi:MAG: family 20 glycosylhydrolase [Clostridia bacterium]|nr:family 20 glycosylhydrolase [Clostridia bacterium]